MKKPESEYAYQDSILFFGRLNVKVNSNTAFTIDLQGRDTVIFAHKEILGKLIAHIPFTPESLYIPESLSGLLARLNLMVEVRDTRGPILKMGMGQHSVLGKFVVNYSALLRLINERGKNLKSGKV